MAKKKRKKTSSGGTPFVERMNQAHVDDLKKQSDLLEHKERMEQRMTNYPPGARGRGSRFYPRRSRKDIFQRTAEQEAANIHARKPDAVEGTNVRLPTTLRSEKLGFDAGGPVKRNSRDGYAKGGLTKVPRQDDNAALMQAGGYLGGLTETGRGTMAGELGRRGDMSVREAGETMHELARRRGYDEGGGIGFTASNVLRDAVSATLTKKKKKKKKDK